MRQMKSLHDLRYEAYIAQLRNEGAPQEYIRFYELYSIYDAGFRSDFTKPTLNPEEHEELLALIRRRQDIEVSEDLVEALYQKTWKGYYQYVKEHSPRISPVMYLDMLGSQYGLTLMQTAQMTDVDIVKKIAREILFREMLAK